jgi:hypothetical protein
MELLILAITPPYRGLFGFNREAEVQWLWGESIEPEMYSATHAVAIK